MAIIRRRRIDQSNRYPTPHTVASGSSGPSFLRSWATWTSTVRSSPYQSDPHTPSRSCWRDRASPGIGGQEGQQIELARGEAHRLTTAAHLAAAHVHLEVADGDDLLWGRSFPGPPQDGPHASHQLAW